MSAEVIALTVTVTAEQMPGGNEAYGVSINAHEKVTTEWAVDFLRKIADGLEKEPFDLQPQGSGS